MGIDLQEVSYTYQAGTPFEGRALFGVDLEIVDGSYTPLLGIRVQVNQRFYNS